MFATPTVLALFKPSGWPFHQCQRSLIWNGGVISPKGTNTSVFGQIHELYQFSPVLVHFVCLCCKQLLHLGGLSVVLFALKPVHKLTPSCSKHFHNMMVKVRIRLVLEAIITELSGWAVNTALLAAEIELIAHK